MTKATKPAKISRMAAPITTTNTATRCSFHHGPADQCPPLDAELGDLLPELIARRVNILITPVVAWLDPCSGCAENRDFPPNDSVAVIVYTVTDLVTAYRYREYACPACLLPAVKWQLDRGANVTVQIPERIGQVA